MSASNSCGRFKKIKSSSPHTHTRWSVMFNRVFKDVKIKRVRTFPGWSGWFKLSRCSAVNPAGLSGREQLMCGTCGVCKCGDGTASDRPVLLLPRQRVWEGGISGDRLSHLLPRRPRLANRLPLSVQPRSDRRARFTYANDMEMTQTRGHADRFHFGPACAPTELNTLHPPL